MNNVKEILFAKYSEKMENSPATELDSILNDALCALDYETSDAMLIAVQDVINEQMKLAFMAGFSAGTKTSKMVYAAVS